MAEGSFRVRPDQAPTLACGRLDHLHLVAGWKNVRKPGLERDFSRAVLALPLDRLVVEIDVNILRDIEDVRILFVDPVAFRLEMKKITVAIHHSDEAVIHWTGIFAEGEIFAEIE